MKEKRTEKPVLVCTSCTQPVEDGALFCPNCGEPINYAAPKVDPFIGRVVSQRYTIVQRIARGGMGEVYLARHAELGQRAAVKFLHRRFADDEELAARFLNEARSACKVTHANAVKIQDFGRLDDGTLYMVMEYVDGLSLGALIRRERRIEVLKAVRVAHSVADALAAAHAEHVIHRDVKPDNIMVVEKHGQRPAVKVLDFGIAKILDEDGNGGLTQTGMMFGTPEYMSPEQASGSRVDHRSDIYALGLVLYEMLSGNPPFQGQNKLGLLQRHIREAPMPIDRASPMTIPAALTRLVGAMLEKDPARRPQTMGEVASALDVIELDLVKAGKGGEASRSNDPGATQAQPELGAFADERPAARKSILTHNTHVPSSLETPARAAAAASSPPARQKTGPQASPSTASYRLGGSPDEHEEGFSLGDEPPVARGTSGFTLGDREDDFEDDRYAAARRGGSSARMGVALAIALAVVIGGVYFAITWIDRLAAETARGGVAASATAVAPPASGSGQVADGSGLAAAPDASPSTSAAPTARAVATARGAAPGATRPANPELVDGLIREVRMQLEAGSLENALAKLSDLLSAEGAKELERVQSIEAVVKAAKRLSEEATTLLAEGQCVRGDEKVVELKKISNALGAAFYPKLRECEARTAGSAPAPTRSASSGRAPASTRSSSRPARNVLPPDEL